MKQIIVTSAGIRTYMVSALVDAARRYGGWTVTACDSSPLAPALYSAHERRVVPPVADQERFLKALLRIGSEAETSVLLPLSDLDLVPLAESRSRLESANLHGFHSPVDSIRICMDKWLMGQRLSEEGISMPRSWRGIDDYLDDVGEELERPLIVKDCAGSASQGLQRITTLAQLRGLHDLDRPVIVQEELDGPEVGVDAFFSADSQIEWLSAKRKLRMRAGETDKAILVDEAPFEHLVQEIGTILRLQGPIDLDLMNGPHGPCPIDINPRIGGGYPLAHAAGASYPERLMSLLDARMPPLPSRPVRRGLIMMKEVLPVIMPETDLARDES